MKIFMLSSIPSVSWLLRFSLFECEQIQLWCRFRMEQLQNPKISSNLLKHLASNAQFRFVSLEHFQVPSRWLDHHVGSNKHVWITHMYQHIKQHNYKRIYSRNFVCHQHFVRYQHRRFSNESRWDADFCGFCVFTNSIQPQQKLTHSRTNFEPAAEWFFSKMTFSRCSWTAFSSAGFNYTKPDFGRKNC